MQPIPTAPRITAEVSSTGESYEDGQSKPLSLTPQGRLRVSIEAPVVNFFASKNPWGDFKPTFGFSPWG